GERQHYPGLRSQLSGPGGFPTQCGVGPDAEHAPTIDLCEYLGAYPAWHDDFFDLDGVQPAERWLTGRYGCEAVKEVDVVQSEGPNGPAPTQSRQSPEGPAPTQWRQGPDGPVPAQSRQALLTVRALRKYFPVRGGILQTVQAQVKAVDGVSFEVQRGEILGIVGESGCGKSTLARLIQHLIAPDAGEIRFAGQNTLATSA